MVCDRHFGILNYKVPSSSLSMFIYFGPHIFHFCRSAQTVPAFEAIVKVTNNYVHVYIWIKGQRPRPIMTLGTMGGVFHLHLLLVMVANFACMNWG